MGIAAQTTKDILDAAASQGLAVMTPLEVETSMTPEKYLALKRCRDRVSCVQANASRLGVDRVVIGSLDRDEKNYLVKLWLIDLKTVSVVSVVDRTILIASRRLSRDIAQAVPGFLRGEQEAKGTLVVKCDVRGASVFLNNALVGKTPFSVDLKPGKYELRVEKKAYTPVARLAAVEAGQALETEIRMLVIPGQTPDPDEAPEVVETEKVIDKSITISPGTWIFGALTIAGAGLATGFGIASSGQVQKLRDGYNKDTGIYNGTQNAVAEAQTNALVANIGFGVTGALAAITVVFAIIDVRVNNAAPDAAVTLAPMVLEQGAGVAIGGKLP